MATTFRRLPTVAKPEKYSISITPDLKAFTFSGKAVIDVEVTTATAELVLNQSDLGVTSAVATVGGADSVAAVELAKEAEELVLKFPAPLPVGPLTLAIDYTGTLNDKMHGFYRSKYELNGQTKYMATTQFESTYARKAFPCWDEPAYKANFNITLTVPKDLTALSNMPVLKEEAAGELKTVSFAETPKMSSYLVALIVGDLEYIAAKTKTGIDVRVYTLPGKKDQGKFALECGVKALEYYDGFFGVPYPLPKSDLIAIPDFAMGAMENWGLVTYREVYLLVDDAKSSQAAKTHISLIVGHELAHMWFGNLATMKWWTDLWLKEGFATYMEYMFVAECYPEFQIWMQFANDEIARGFSLDSLRSSHPIEVPIANPNELEEIYDAVSYAKSASVIGMLCAHLGVDTFRKATSAYLKKFSFANAETSDLWAAFSEASGQDVAALMKMWTGRMGFPVVSASVTESGSSRTLSLKQRRFIADGSDDAEGTVWAIPIAISTKSSPDAAVHKILLDEKEKTFTLDGIAAGDWLKLNAGMKGYYRVAYDAAMLTPLLDAVSAKVLGPLERFNLVTDTFALVRAGVTPASAFLQLLKACSAEEDNFNVWVELDTGISALHNCLFRKPELLPAFYAFVRAAYAPAAARLGWDAKEGEPIQAGRLRSLILGRLGISQDPAVGAKVKELVSAKGVDLHPDLRGMILRVYAQLQGREGFEKLKSEFAQSDFAEVQRQCLGAMACSPDAAVAKDALQFGVDNVRPGDMYLIFMSATSTKEGQEVAWAYVQEHFDAVAKLYGGPNSALFQAICKMTTKPHCSEEMAVAVDAFFAGKALPVLQRPVQQSVEGIRLNALLLSKNADDLTKWLASN